MSRRAKSELPAGVKLVQTLEGHADLVTSLTFSPQGETLVSGSHDKRLKLWDVRSGQVLRTLEGHDGAINSVAFDPQGGTLASGSGDKTVRLWEPRSGKLLHTLKGHRDWVRSVVFDTRGEMLASGNDDGTVKLWARSGELLRTLEGRVDVVYSAAFDPQGGMLANGSSDNTVNLWDVRSGKLIRTLEGHQKAVVSVVFCPQGGMLASGSTDNTVRLWDARSGKLLRTLEGHTKHINAVAFSCDGRLLASKSRDHTIRLWSCETWETVAIIPEPTGSGWIPALAFHPTLPLLAASGSEPSTPEHERCRPIHIWELDAEVLLGRHGGGMPAGGAVRHTTGKIVLVGDSGVGKTGLGWRLAHGTFKEHSSTHGQQFWVLNQLNSRRRDGTECEAVLWDLAGQPDYRLIHALFLNDADLALVLFDPSDMHDPLHGVEFWLRQLKGQQANCAVILVGARSDRGVPSLTTEELERFCRQRGISTYISTSAATGAGVAELIEQMKTLIPWDDKPATVTTATLKRIKDYVLSLKEVGQERQAIVSEEQLRERLQENDANWQFTHGEMMTAVGCLENYGYLKRLRTSKGEERILLMPDLLNNLASSFAIEARRNPKGLGALEEERLLAGDYRFPELEMLPGSDSDVLLDAGTLLFLEHQICFREIDPLTEQSYLVFPELINLKKPHLANESPTFDGVSYSVVGAVENVFASLVVLLGYTRTFTRTDQWRNQARYEVGAGLVCGFRQEMQGEGELAFVLYFGANVGTPVRTLFQGLFESFLARRNLTVMRYEPVRCGNAECGHLLDRSVVRQRMKESKDFAFCNDCGERLALPKMAEPIQLTRAVEAEVEVQRRTAEQRTRFEQAVFQVQSYVAGQKMRPVECFISYAWGTTAKEKEHERWVEKRLATDLQKAGIGVVLDRWHNTQIGASVPRFVERIEKCDRVVMVGTPLYRRKYENKDTSTGYIVAAEVDLIANRLLGTEAQKKSVLPVLLDGEKQVSLPPLLHGRVYADFRNEAAYFITAFDLILSLYQLPAQHAAVADLRESLCRLDAAGGLRAEMPPANNDLNA